MQETDLSRLRGNRPAHTTAYKVQMQGAMNCGDDSKTSEGSASTLAPVATQDSEPSDKTRKDKKKKYHRDKKEPREPRKDSTTPASGVNAIEVSEGR